LVFGVPGADDEDATAGVFLLGGLDDDDEEYLGVDCDEAREFFELLEARGSVSGTLNAPR
jgi:hypothetical protein